MSEVSLTIPELSDENSVDRRLPYRYTHTFYNRNFENIEQTSVY